MTDHSDKITSAGDKILAFVKSKGGESAAAEVEKGITSSTTALKKAEDDGSDAYEVAADAAVATFEAIGGSIEKFESGDPYQIASGVLDILAEASQFAALAGPEGQIVAAIVGPLCKIISSIFGAQGDPPESDEDMLKRVVTEALDVQTSNDLNSSAAGVMDHMVEKMKTVKTFFEKADTLGSQALKHINDDNFVKVGSEFLGKLWYYIEKDTKTDDVKTARRTAVYISTYVSLVYLRCQHLFMLAALYGTNPDLEIVTETTKQIALDMKKTCGENLQFLFDTPKKENHITYAKFRLQPIATLNTIEAICDARLPGAMVFIFNTHQKLYLTVDESDDERSEARTEHEMKHTLSDSNKFIVFGLSPSGVGTKVKIFSLAHAGYVHATDYKPKDKDRRRVYSLTGSLFMDWWDWTLTEYEQSGEVRVMNNRYREYIYSADYGGNAKERPVYAWIPGNEVTQGTWFLHDIYPPPPTNTFLLQSAAFTSWYFCGSGERGSLSGNFGHLITKPSCWEFIKLGDGTYNIKIIGHDRFAGHTIKQSVVINGIFLPGPEVSLCLATRKAASVNDDYKWRLKQYSYDGRMRYAIQNVASELYFSTEFIQLLVSRPMMLSQFGHQSHYSLTLAEGNPQNDKNLLWDLEEWKNPGE